VLPANASVSGDGVLELSDSLPAVTLPLALNRCPGVDAQRSVALLCGGQNPNVTVQNLELAIAPAASAFQSIDCSSRSISSLGPDSILLPLSLQLLPSFRSAASEVEVTCALSASDGTSMGSATLRVHVTPTRWPTFDDVFIVANNGFARSVLGNTIINATGALFVALADWDAEQQQQRQQVSVARRLLAASPSPGPLARALANPAVVLAAVRSLWFGVPLPSLGRNGETVAFDLTLFDKTPLILRSRHRDSFSPSLELKIGGVVSNGTSVAEDGDWAATIAPGPDTLCGNSADGCSYALIALSNPPTYDQDQILTARGATLTCPPFCALTVSGSGEIGGVFPLAVSTANVFVPAVLAPGESGAVATTDVEAVTSATGGSVLRASTGLFYATACSATGVSSDCVSFYP
jgi:hypothetical protein